MAQCEPTLTASNIKYLLVLRELCRGREGVRCVAIAELLGVAKPSVHAMLHTLRDMGLIEKDPYGSARFTPAGQRLAETYGEYYDAICAYLARMLPQGADMRAAVCALLAEIPRDGIEVMCERIQTQAACTQ